MNEHESYVSLETAELLKEAGFKWWTDQYYGSKTYLKGTDKEVHPDAYSLGEMDWRIVNELIWCGHKNDDSLSYSAPTLAVAQRWLREEKDVDVLVEKRFCAYVYSLGNLDDRSEKVIPQMSVGYDTYEEALEAGIQKCLTIILNKTK